MDRGETPTSSTLLDDIVGRPGRGPVAGYFVIDLGTVTVSGIMLGRVSTDSASASIRRK